MIRIRTRATDQKICKKKQKEQSALPLFSEQFKCKWELHAVWISLIFPNKIFTRGGRATLSPVIVACHFRVCNHEWLIM